MPNHTPVASLSPNEPDNLGLSSLRTQRLMDVLQREVDRGYIPGAVVMLARHGSVALHAAVGQSDPAACVPMRTSDIFRIYSMTKPVVSVAAMMLVEQGRVMLNEPVATYLPEFANQQLAVETPQGVELHPVSQSATVQDLLRHTAGLTYEFMGTAHVQRLYAKAQIGSRARSNAEFSQTLAPMPLLHAPGTQWAYSRATDVLGRLVEVITGQSLGVHLKQTVFDPLGMVDTGFSVPEEDHHRIAEPFAHDPDGGIPLRVLNPREVPAMEAGGGGLMSTTSDYARFLQCLLNRGELDGTRLLGSHTVDFMTADHLGDIPSKEDLLPPGHGFGLGFAVRTQLGVSTMPGSVGTYHWGVLREPRSLWIPSKISSAFS
ncbi:serine hydrolase domain-containing protein [Hydrogenophaga crassostreae]|uniref:serine hydrolase domain-containing protein n=1 Tax=Hydrogenophaga crassostreae TaxID=1763535 RepID=UPI000A8ED06F